MLPVKSWLSLLAKVTQIKPDSVCGVGVGGSGQVASMRTQRRQRERKGQGATHGDKKGREERGEEMGVTKEAETGEKRA